MFHLNHRHNMQFIRENAKVHSFITFQPQNTSDIQGFLFHVKTDTAPVTCNALEFYLDVGVHLSCLSSKLEVLSHSP